jgi:hypothetical protein
MSNIDIKKLRVIADTWRRANSPGSTIDMNELANDTLKMIDTEPLIKEVCQAFLYSVSIQAIKDQSFDSETYGKTDTDHTGKTHKKR